MNERVGSVDREGGASCRIDVDGAGFAPVDTALGSARGQDHRCRGAQITYVDSLFRSWVRAIASVRSTAVCASHSAGRSQCGNRIRRQRIRTEYVGCRCPVFGQAYIYWR